MGKKIREALVHKFYTGDLSKGYHQLFEFAFFDEVPCGMPDFDKSLGGCVLSELRQRGGQLRLMVRYVPRLSQHEHGIEERNSWA